MKIPQLGMRKPKLEMNAYEWFEKNVKERRKHVAIYRNRFPSKLPFF
jgi:hypothetical protein